MSVAQRFQNTQKKVRNRTVSAIYSVYQIFPGNTMKFFLY
ncbi:hypothetical protein HMPREF1548_02949 [Clostridium sp. KLE 1755]|nr:hypothetical protein HMPREF1548_02949 [Clostridium sp. KLE 1755]